MTFGEVMKAALKEQNMSQTALAKECEISRIAVNRYASGEQLPHLNTAIRISKRLNFSLDGLDVTWINSAIEQSA